MSAMDLDNFPSSSTHPNPQPNPHHRKIDLQSPPDLTFLQGNLSRFALQKLDLHFPRLSKPATHISLDGQGDQNKPKAGPQNQNGTQDAQKPVVVVEEEEEEEDPMRRRVRELVSEFLTTTWTSASHNISVNGIDASVIPLPHTATLSSPPSTSEPDAGATTATGPGAAPPPPPLEEVEGKDFQYTPFDAKLQNRLAALHGELEVLTAQVSKLRRTAPGQGAELHERRLRETMDAGQARYEAAARKIAEEDMKGLEIESVRNGWNEDVRDIYDQGLRELAGLAGTGAGQNARQQESRNGHTGGDRGEGGPTLTETVGKAQRASRVAMEME